MLPPTKDGVVIMEASQIKQQWSSAATMIAAHDLCKEYNRKNVNVCNTFMLSFITN